MVIAVDPKKMFLSIFDKIPVRLNVGVMLFMASFISYMLRVNFSITLIGMVEPSGSEKLVETLTEGVNGTTTEMSTIEMEHRYSWSKYEQSLLLGAYFWGYIFPNLMGGFLAERYGGRNVIFITLFMSALVTAASPLAANDNFLFMFGARLVLGVLGGFFYPAAHNIISRWAPPDEKGKFIATLLGGIFGTVVTWPMTGIIIESLGWRFAFYIPALLTLGLSGLWLYLVSDSPQNHPRISKAEKDLIEKSLGSSLSAKKSWPPMSQMLTSMPFYSLLLLHFGSIWGLFFLLTAAPKFMTEVLQFNLAKAGILSSLPYLARLISGFIFGGVGDFIRSKNIMSVTTIRKSFCLFSHIIPGLFLIGLCFVGFNPYVCVAVITLSLGFNGAATMTNLQNSQDLAPNFAGSLYGIINFIGTTSGFISPVLVAHFTAERSTMDEWQYVFYIGAAVYIVPALFFIIFGSGEVQKWNDKKDIKEEEAQNAS